VRELLATREAISRVEARYLDGHSALFPDMEGVFENQVRQSQQLSVMAADSAELDGVESPESDDPDALEERIGQLVADLVEPAKSEALDKLGEGTRALGIATNWLRKKPFPYQKDDLDATGHRGPTKTRSTVAATPTRTSEEAS
jgi:hypothetical protein